MYIHTYELSGLNVALECCRMTAEVAVATFAIVVAFYSQLLSLLPIYLQMIVRLFI